MNELAFTELLYDDTFVKATMTYVEHQSILK